MFIFKKVFAWYPNLNKHCFAASALSKNSDSRPKKKKIKQKKKKASLAHNSKKKHTNGFPWDKYYAL